MIAPSTFSQPEPSPEAKAIGAALRKAQLQAMRLHVFGNVPMVSWKDGKVVEIPPSELRRMLEEAGVEFFGSPI